MANSIFGSTANTITLCTALRLPVDGVKDTKQINYKRPLECVKMLCLSEMHFVMIDATIRFNMENGGIHRNHAASKQIKNTCKTRNQRAQWCHFFVAPSIPVDFQRTVDTTKNNPSSQITMSDVLNLHEFPVSYAAVSQLLLAISIYQMLHCHRVDRIRGSPGDIEWNAVADLRIRTRALQLFYVMRIVWYPIHSVSAPRFLIWRIVTLHSSRDWVEASVE